MLLLLSSPIRAQLNYNFSVHNQTYTPLTNAISMNGAVIWDDESFKVPMGFTFTVNGVSIDSFNLLLAQLIGEDTTAIFSGFSTVGADLWDKGSVSRSISMSPIRYQVSGAAPNRIFKAEVFNAGFYDEFDMFGTNSDYLSFQVWLYETSNVFEIHFGASNINHASDYFSIGAGKPLVGYFRNLDLDNGVASKLYYLKGNPVSPLIDSTSDLTTFSDGLNSFPSEGTIYRFAPKTTTVTDVINLIKVRVYPTITADQVFIDNDETDEVSYLIYSTDARQVGKQGTLLKGINSIGLVDMPKGVYVVQLQSKVGFRTHRIIKK